MAHYNLHYKLYTRNYIYARAISTSRKGEAENRRIETFRNTRVVFRDLIKRYFITPLEKHRDRD